MDTIRNFLDILSNGSALPTIRLILGVFFALLLLSFLLSYGLYQLVCDYISAPSKKARRAVLAMKKTKVTPVEAITTPIAQFLCRFIRLDNDRKTLLQKKLYSAEIPYTPEYFVATALAEAFFIGAFAIPSFFLFPIVGIVFVVLGISVYFKNMQELDKIIGKKAEVIDGQLVLFSSTIKQQLSTSRDVMKILQSFRKICAPEFTHELDKTVAEMKTGNYETALRNLEQRIPSIGLSEIIRGLLAVMRGDDQRGYFEMLTHDLTVKAKEDLKRAALKRPEKIKPATVSMLCAFILMYMYVVIYMVSEQLMTLFK